MRIYSSTVKMAGSFSDIPVKNTSAGDFKDFLSAAHRANKTEAATTGYDIKVSIPVSVRIIKNVEPDDNNFVNVVQLQEDDLDNQKLAKVKKLLEALTGKKVRFISYKPQEENPEYTLYLSNRNSYKVSNTDFSLKSNTTAPRFVSTGSVETKDGRKIDFSVDVNIKDNAIVPQKEKVEEKKPMVDPLVINFSTGSAELTETKIQFDLNSDGKNESISFVGGGSGLLSLDLDNNGSVNNGRELFGPSSGDGFLELQQYDSDGNQWIDENDPIFEKLKIWTKNEKNEDVFFSLKDKGVGAIYTNGIDTGVDLKVNGKLEGTLAKTGIFLNENGTAGTVQDVNLTI